MSNRPHSEYEPWYRALKRHDHDLLKQCIAAGEGVTLSHNLKANVAADVEIAIVMMVCEALNLLPAPS